MVLRVVPNCDSIIPNHSRRGREIHADTGEEPHQPLARHPAGPFILLPFEAGPVADQELSGHTAAVTGQEASLFDLPRSKKPPALQRGCWQLRLSLATSGARAGSWGKDGGWVCFA